MAPRPSQESMKYATIEFSYERANLIQHGAPGVRKSTASFVRVPDGMTFEFAKQVLAEASPKRPTGEPQ